MRPPIFVGSLLSDTESKSNCRPRYVRLRLSSCAEPRSSSPENRGERASQIARSRWAAASRRCVMPSTTSTDGAFGCLGSRILTSEAHPSRLRRRAEREALFELLHQDPRKFGKEDTFWTLQHYAAEASFEQGITERQVSVARPSGQHLGDLVCTGNGPSAGSRAPIPSTTPAKRGSRPADPARRSRSSS